jgi:hypothetical protein
MRWDWLCARWASAGRVDHHPPGSTSRRRPWCAFSARAGHVFDMFDPREMTEPSIISLPHWIRRAVALKLAKRAKAGPGPRASIPSPPLATGTIEAALLLLSAHELRTDQARMALFTEARVLGSAAASSSPSTSRRGQLPRFRPRRLHLHSRRTSTRCFSRTRSTFTGTLITLLAYTCEETDMTEPTCASSASSWPGWSWPTSSAAALPLAGGAGAPLASTGRSSRRTASSVLTLAFSALLLTCATPLERRDCGSGRMTIFWGSDVDAVFFYSPRRCTNRFTR